MAAELPIAGESSCGVPVFDCHILISGPDSEGLLSGRVSNLPQITATARGERHLLQQLVKDFKSEIQKYHRTGQPIPWTPPEVIQEGERQRWVPVHL